MAAVAHEHGLAYGLSLQHSLQHATSQVNAVESTSKPLAYYLSVYVVLAAASAILGTLRFLWSFVMSFRASRAMFRRILFTMMRTKLRWIDTVPVGRILNRMTADFDIIENRLTLYLGSFFWRVLGLLGICVAAVLVSTSILPLAAFLIVFAALVSKRFMEGARSVKRLESTAKSPVFELFNSTLAGVSLLRAFQKTHVYVERMYDLLDNWDTLSVYAWTLNRWLGLRMALIGTLFTTLVGFILVGSPFVDAAMAGFTLSFALDFSGNMLMTVRGYASLDLDMNAAERVVEYSEVETEDLGGEEPPAAWPTSGRIEVKDLVASYASDEALRDCLARVHLIDSESARPADESASAEVMAATSVDVSKNVNIFRDLDSPISESGGNLSQGQRQLICMARAIADFDRILVLSDGRVAEFGAPHELWDKSGGLFRAMCEHSGERDRLEEMITDGLRRR